MTWTSVRAAIKAAAATASGLHPKQIAWAKRPQGATNRTIVLQVVSTPPDHPARVLRVLNGAGTSFDVSVSKTVTFVCNVRAEVLTPDATGDSFDLAENFRLGLELPSVRETLTAAGVVLVGIPMSVTPLGQVTIDDREVDATLFDVSFRAEFFRADPTSQGWISRVEGEGTLTDLDGTEIVVPFEAEGP